MLRRIADGVDELRQLARSAAVSSSTTRLAVPIAEAAELLGCRRTTVFGLLRRGVLKRAQKAGRNTLILQDSIQEALEAPKPTNPALRHRRSTRSAWKPIDRRRLGV